MYLHRASRRLDVSLCALKNESEDAHSERINKSSPDSFLFAVIVLVPAHSRASKLERETAHFKKGPDHLDSAGYLHPLSVPEKNFQATVIKILGWRVRRIITL